MANLSFALVLIISVSCVISAEEKPVNDQTEQAPTEKMQETTVGTVSTVPPTRLPPAKVSSTMPPLTHEVTTSKPTTEAQKDKKGGNGAGAFSASYVLLVLSASCLIFVSKL